MLTDDGASGANGLGSVMESKRLKAIAVAGEKRPVAADPERLDHCHSSSFSNTAIPHPASLLRQVMAQEIK